jgi:hypothetical protein
MSGQIRIDSNQRNFNRVMRLLIKSEPINLPILYQPVCVECKQLFSPQPHSIDMCVDCFLQLDTVYAMEWPVKE